MKSLWQQRFVQHAKEQSKFLKLVFNEYFILAIIFLIGAVGFWYSQALDQLPPNSWWARPVAILVLGLVTLLFKPVTLLQAADAAFLLPREKELPQYLVAARRYSLIMPSITTALTGFFLTPFLARGAAFTLVKVVFLTLTAIVAAISIIINQFNSLYQKSTIFSKIGQNTLGSFLLLIIAAYVNEVAALILALIWCGFNYYQWQQLAAKQIFNWLQAVDIEANRSYQLKRFYNLFTDVPGIAHQAVRRQWLDWLLKPIKPKHRNAYLYLFARGFLRNSDYSGIFVRLTIICLLLIYAIHNYLLITIITALFLYLVEFQLLPLYKNYDGIVLTQIYPLTQSQKQQSFQVLLLVVLGMQWLFIVITLLLCNHLTTQLLWPVVVSLLMVIFLLKWYLPRQLTKLNK
ncbi:ABC transporter permease [Bombilactobacillus bombi]|uniref:ABC transporter permease n=1 Tax=Bombilactobacillus bombi TaxID=1303590 RepID=UPI0015E5EA40|nr:ABC transporter permease [Bombilactobacillus bombi]MBA1434579.1 ABC transporter permease [Bombilactobacillus bombi]